jgi:hypothetical protein
MGLRGDLAARPWAPRAPRGRGNGEGNIARSGFRAAKGGVPGWDCAQLPVGCMGEGEGGCCPVPPGGRCPRL